MTAPERLYAGMDTAHQCQGKWECVPFEVAPDSPQYIRADLHDAAIAKARAEGMREAEALVAKLWGSARYGSNEAAALYDARFAIIDALEGRT